MDFWGHKANIQDQKPIDGEFDPKCAVAGLTSDLHTHTHTCTRRLGRGSALHRSHPPLHIHSSRLPRDGRTEWGAASVQSGPVRGQRVKGSLDHSGLAFFHLTAQHLKPAREHPCRDHKTVVENDGIARCTGERPSAKAHGWGIARSFLLVAAVILGSRRAQSMRKKSQREREREKHPEKRGKTGLPCVVSVRTYIVSNRARQLTIALNVPYSVSAIS